MLPYRFTGKELDRETGLYYYGARYLNPKTSRWVSGDPAGWELINPNRENVNVIESINWYSYTSNNPVKYVDPTGMEGEYTIDLTQYENQDFQIDFYVDNNEDPITARFDGETYSIGEDLVIGDSVPFDADFSVPEGSSLEIKGDDSTTFKMHSTGDVNLPESIGEFNKYVQSDNYKQALKEEQKMQGYSNLGVAGLEIAGGLFLGSKFGPMGGGGLFLLGFQTLPFALNDISASREGRLLDYGITTEVLAKPITYINLR